MLLNGGGGVAEDFGDDGRGRELGDLMECAEASGACADRGAESAGDVAGVEVPAGGVAGEDPVAVGVGGGLVVVRLDSELAERLVERWV